MSEQQETARNSKKQQETEQERVCIVKEGRTTRESFNDSWEFLEMPLGTDLAEARDAADRGLFRRVRIPHDWQITGGKELYRNGTGWYRKSLTWSGEKAAETAGKDGRVFLIFDGIYMDSRIYLNGECVGEWKYGYTRFALELTGKLLDGENELMVSANFLEPNSRWYSGAGINRNVWLMTTPSVCMEDGGLYVSSARAEDGGWELHVEAEISSRSQSPEYQQAAVTVRLLDADGREILPAAEQETPARASLTLTADQPGRETVCRRAVGTALHFEEKAGIVSWDIENPALYLLEVRLLGKDGSLLQTEKLRIGFREISFDPEQGFLLNGRKVKLNGVCLHPDQGALGTAFHRDALRRQYRIMQRMGANAVRFSHNPFAAEALDLADEMGLLVLDESFDMWERSKTTYDYARFFDAWQARDMASFVRRDRNHPCVIMWSIGNEIYDQHADEKGRSLTKMLMEEVEALDPLGNARVTAASNYMPWENTQQCADLYKLVGYNYSEKYYAPHHAEHPDWVIYGSETCSLCSSRGIYHFPLAAGILAEEDEQCSALGNSPTSWGAKSLEECIAVDRDLPYSMGQFLWSGFDYIGEPTPYHTRNSYLGQVDTAGFAKDAFYVWQSAWTSADDAPMVHVFPYWDFNPGQEVDLRVCSNAEEVELRINGVSQGRQKLDHAPGSGRHLIADWKAVYEPGEITAIAYEGGREVARQTRRSFGDTDHFVVKEEENGRGEFPRSESNEEPGKARLHFYEITAEDADGHPVENASDRVEVLVSGGRLLGLDNGDSTDYDSYTSDCRRLFSGKLLAIVEENDAETDIVVTVKPAGEVSVRKIVLSAEDGQVFGPEQRVLRARAVICPQTAADQNVVFTAVDDNGVASNLVSLEQKGGEVTMTAHGDGAFHLRATSKNGTDRVRLISQLEYRAEGLGPAYLDPYGFISGSLYTSCSGEVGIGNEKGVATSRTGETVVTWTGIDFGPVGSDEITVPIFALSDEEYPIEIWLGKPGEDGAELLVKAVYCKPCIWNVYQEETYHLPHRIKGLSSISIRTQQKIHIKGFSFTKSEKAWTRLFAAESDGVYGDAFRMDGTAVRDIGNNVSLSFKEMDFGNRPLHGIRVCGSTPLAGNTIHVRFYDGVNEEKEILEYRGDGEAVQEFPLKERTGRWDLTFVFLPGSRFDFEWFELF